MIQPHGDDAATHAAMKADALLDAGDLEGTRAWQRILRAIGELTATAPDGEKTH